MVCSPLPDLSFSGVALAADGAKPGDLLYGLDRALEAVGVSNGGASERIAEVEALIDAGAIADGLDHVSTLLGGNQARDQARAALEAAAAQFNETAENPGPNAAQPIALINYLRAAVASGEGVDGQAVADMARELDSSPGDPACPPLDPGPHRDPAGPLPDPGPHRDPAGPLPDPGPQGDPERGTTTRGHTDK
jgi:hypothetical protein